MHSTSFQFSSMQTLPKNKNKQNLGYTRYNVAFLNNAEQQKNSNNNPNNSINRSKCQKLNKNDNISKSKSCQNKYNYTFTKYSYFPAHLSRHKDQKISQQSIKRKQDNIKWLGVSGVKQSQLQSTFVYRNAFPQRKTKGSDQMIMNMLLKYQKYYGKQGDQSQLNSLNQFGSIYREEENKTPYYLSQRQKKTQRKKWFQKSYTKNINQKQSKLLP